MDLLNVPTHNKDVWIHNSGTLFNYSRILFIAFAGIKFRCCSSFGQDNTTEWWKLKICEIIVSVMDFEVWQCFILLITSRADIIPCANKRNINSTRLNVYLIIKQNIEDTQCNPLPQNCWIKIMSIIHIKGCYYFYSFVRKNSENEHFLPLIVLKAALNKLI